MMTNTATERKRMVIDHLTWDDSVNADNIKVTVEEGTAVLYGTVQNFTAKMAAERDAYQVKGIREVDNQLDIKFPPSKSLPSDGEIKAFVEDQINWNNEIHAGRIQVDCHHNVVTVSGTAESFWEKHKILDMANATIGVIEVRDQLSVKPPRNINDEDLASNICEAFRRNYHIDEGLISVEVKHGSVLLSGEVPSFFVKMEAHNIATYTSGVMDVVDNMTIE
jgi:osmotically-inducible protein OsmY